jgi:hypothetical protein
MVDPKKSYIILKIKLAMNPHARNVR